MKCMEVGPPPPVEDTFANYASFFSSSPNSLFLNSIPSSMEPCAYSCVYKSRCCIIVYADFLST